MLQEEKIKGLALSILPSLKCDDHDSVESHILNVIKECKERIKSKSYFINFNPLAISEVVEQTGDLKIAITKLYYKIEQDVEYRDPIKMLSDLDCILAQYCFLKDLSWYQA